MIVILASGGLAPWGQAAGIILGIYLFVSIILGLAVAAALMLTNGALSASDAPVVHVKAVVKDGAVTLDAQANGPFEYTTYRPSESLYVLDLSGVSAGDTSGARVVPSELVKSYRLTTYSAGQKPVVRLEILLRPGVEPRLQRNDNHELMLSVSANGNADADDGLPAAPPSLLPEKLSPIDLPSTLRLAGVDNPEILLDVKANGNPRGVRRQTQNEETHALGEIGPEIPDRTS